MYLLDAQKNRVEVEELPQDSTFESAAAVDAMRAEAPIAKAQRAFFEVGREKGALRAAVPPPSGPPPTAVREVASGLVRTFHREVVVRFKKGTSAEARQKLLEGLGLEVRRKNTFIADQVVTFDRSRRRSGGDLMEVANRCAEADDVLFAAPNFVSEYRRFAAAVPMAQWHLVNKGKKTGQVAGEDVEALEAWKLTRGARSIVVAVLDDGVDIDHPNLKANVWRNSSTSAKDRFGRDFFLPDDHPNHFDPRPKKFRFPFDQMRGNDIHGTPCAGVIAAAGKGAIGIAPRCRVLAVKVFHADELAPDERVANAIRYAAGRADVLSCSWSGPVSPDIQLALADAQQIGRKGRGSAIFCATGNEASRVGFPAKDANAVAVGASTDQADLANYSNTGPEVDVVAPSSGGIEGIFTTDVSVAGRGFNIGKVSEGGKDGLHTNSFGGTSSATPLAAGVAGLVLSVNPKLSRKEVQDVLQSTADKIGTGYDAQGFSPRFGRGRVNAARAVAEAKKRKQD
jgi:subtilisin family serine protease